MAEVECGSSLLTPFVFFFCCLFCCCCHPLQFRLAEVVLYRPCRRCQRDISIIFPEAVQTWVEFVLCFSQNHDLLKSSANEGRRPAWNERGFSTFSAVPRNLCAKPTHLRVSAVHAAVVPSYYAFKSNLRMGACWCFFVQAVGASGWSGW